MFYIHSGGMCVCVCEKEGGVLIVSEWSKIAQITVMNLSVIMHSLIEFVYS